MAKIRAEWCGGIEREYESDVVPRVGETFAKREKEFLISEVIHRGPIITLKLEFKRKVKL